MTVRWCVLLCTILLCSTLQVNAARGYRGGSHSYPKSGGLSGSHSSGHSYPSNHGGLSGNSHGGAGGQTHAYPSSGGQSHGYPSSGGQSHGYPSSGGQSHGYPSSGGSHGYPSSGGLSGNSPSRPISHNTHHTTNVYNNYHYSPPQQIRYTPPHGGAPVSYPVYRGAPPTYVYQYKDSGSKYGTLLAGLALLNLGTLAVAGAAYAHSSHGSSSSQYRPAPGEVCKFGIKKDNGDYEETRIDCQLITSFIFQEEQAKAQNGGTNTTVVTTTVTNVTMVNGTNGVPEPAPAAVPGNIVYTMLPNGTLVPLNGTLINGTFVPGAVNATNPEAPSPPTNGATSSVTTMTTNTTTVVNALDVKGSPVEVTPGMKCYVIRHTSSSNMKKSVPCGVLQSYATQSLKKNSATRNLPVFTALSVVVAMILAY